MKRFITKRKIKVPRYKLLYGITFSIICLMIIIKLGINIIFNKINKDNLGNILANNSFGNIFYESSDKDNFLIKNVFGFPFNTGKMVSKESNDLPLVYIYNTFQTDKYVNNYYSSYSINPVVTQANLILEEYLKDRKINAVVEKSSVVKTLKEEGIDYSLSYKGSRILMEKAKNNNPSLSYFLDIGLSEDKKEVTTYESEENNWAKILFIVGTDNPNYIENEKFARLLNQKLEHINKNISRGISLRGGEGFHGIYNQDFSPNTLRIFIGGKENTIDEVNRTLEVLAQVLEEYIWEDNNEKK